MTHSSEAVEWVQALHYAGINQSKIARTTGVSRSSVGEWVRSGRSGADVARPAGHVCGAPCPHLDDLPQAEYAYLLGLYLGDGCLTPAPRKVWRLRIACCSAYPHLMDLCEEAMRMVLPNSVGRLVRTGYTELYSNSKHWICLFPQHAPGKKHERRIELTNWQNVIARRHARHLLTGLIHSDGCRSLNTVNPRGVSYAYPRYFLTNVSDDIRGIFCQACDALGVEWRQMNKWTISIARRRSVEFLDTFIGPKA